MILLSRNLVAQQLPQFSQHMYNKQVLNPAITGSENFMVTQLTHRSQWAGFGNAPTTQFLSIHSSIDRKNYGVGGYLFNDSFGPFNNFGLNGSYAYHIKVSDDTKLGFGLSGTVSQFSINGNDIKLSNDIDPLINLSSSESNLKYNGSFGLLLHHNTYYVGFSALNIIPQNNNVFTSLDTPGALPTVTHFNTIAGIGIDLDDNNTLYPSILVKYINNNPIQVDFNIRYIYSTIFEIGASYRSGDAIVGIVNFYIMDDLNFIYSYDFTTSNVSSVSSGSHEITLRYKFYYNPIYKKQKKRYNLKTIKKRK